MRMNQKSNICAKQIINSYKEVDLNKLFKEYADFKNPSRISSVIIKNRAIKEIKSVSDLTSILSEIFKGPKKINFLPELFKPLELKLIKKLNV